MSNFGQQIFSSLIGNYSLESKLRSIRGKLSEINSAVRTLESNMIFLLVNPELVNYSSESSNNNQQMTERVSGPDEQHQAAVSRPRIDYGQEEFLTNPSELRGQYAESMGLRYELMTNEDEILDALDLQKKKTHRDSVYSAHNYSNNEHPFH